MVKSKKLFFLIFLVIFSIPFNFCASAEKKEQLAKDLTVQNEQASALLDIIKDFNSNSPSTIQASFTAKGENAGKKFNVEGNLSYDKNGYYYVSFTDYIFKSQILDAAREENRLYFYYPADKKLLVDNINKIEFSSYIGFNCDFLFMHTLLSGAIPTPKDFTVNKLLQEGKDSYFLILENNEYFESIYIKENMPEKILLINKNKKDKIEIYLKSPLKKDKSHFYKKIKIIIPAQGIDIDISFNNAKINEPITVKKIDPLKIKKGTEIIKINE